MPDIDGLLEARNFTGDQTSTGGFHVKGANAQDWGLQNRLSRIFRPSTGRTVMLAFDHGYFVGPMAGLERLRSEERRVGKGCRSRWGAEHESEDGTSVDVGH